MLVALPEVLRDVANELRREAAAVVQDGHRAALLERDGVAARDRRDLANDGLVVLRVVGEAVVAVLDGADAQVEEMPRGLVVVLVRDSEGEQVPETSREIFREDHTALEHRTDHFFFRRYVVCLAHSDVVPVLEHGDLRPVRGVRLVLVLQVVRNMVARDRGQQRAHEGEREQEQTSPQIGPDLGVLRGRGVLLRRRFSGFLESLVSRLHVLVVGPRDGESDWRVRFFAVSLTRGSFKKWLHQSRKLLLATQ